MTPRPFIAVCVALSLEFSATAQVLQNESFEAFAAGNLDGQNGWIALPGGNLFTVAPGMAIVSTEAARSGSKSVCLRSDLLATGESLFAFKPVLPAIGLSNSLVISDFWMKSSGASNASFGGASYSSEGDFLASVTANANEGRVSLSWMEEAPATIVPSEWNRITMVHNMASGQIVAFMNGERLSETSGAFLGNYSDTDMFADGSGASRAYFDDVSIERTGLGVIRGKVFLGDFEGSPLGTTLTLTINNPGTNIELLSVPLTLRADSTYSISTGLRGTYDVVIKPWHWLSHRFSNVEITDFGAHFLDAAVINGDVDNSNEVELTDIDLVIAAYGAGAPPNMVPEDVNGNQEVDLTDIDIVISNYGVGGG